MESGVSPVARSGRLRTLTLLLLSFSVHFVVFCIWMCFGKAPDSDQLSWQCSHSSQWICLNTTLCAHNGQMLIFDCGLVFRRSYSDSSEAAVWCQTLSFAGSLLKTTEMLNVLLWLLEVYVKQLIFMKLKKKKKIVQLEVQHLVNSLYQNDIFVPVKVHDSNLRVGYRWPLFCMFFLFFIWQCICRWQVRRVLYI